MWYIVAAGLGMVGGWSLHKSYLRGLYKQYKWLRRKIFKGR